MRVLFPLLWEIQLVQLCYADLGDFDILKSRGHEDFFPAGARILLRTRSSNRGDIHLCCERNCRWQMTLIKVCHVTCRRRHGEIRLQLPRRLRHLFHRGTVKGVNGIDAVARPITVDGVRPACAAVVLGVTLESQSFDAVARPAPPR